MEDLAVPEDPDDLKAIYRGLCHIPKDGLEQRRIDFLTVPWKSRGAALLYYTVCMPLDYDVFRHQSHPSGRRYRRLIFSESV